MKMQLLCALLFSSFATQSLAANSYQVNASASLTITEHSVSKVVTNNCTKAIFVPTKTSTEWSRFYTSPPACVTAVTAGPCGNPPALGTTCSDGALYAGTDSGYYYQTTPGNCTNSATPTCNGASDSLTKIWSVTQVVTGITDWYDGLADTNAIVALYPSDDSAAKYCYNLDYAGHTDWYLPARNEINLISASPGSFSGFSAAAHYWTSVESSNTAAVTNLSSRGKSVSTVRVRCMRKY